jgi:predicted  nucleic acid-binding Zn-ribbon protein
VEHGVEALLQRVSAAEKHIEAIGLRIATTEQALDSVRRQVEDAQRSTASDLQGMERTIAAHGTAIDSARTAMAQTEDLVERVVEALDLLQSTVLDQESRSGLIN